MVTCRQVVVHYENIKYNFTNLTPDYRPLSDFWIYDLDDGAIGTWKLQSLISEQTPFSGFFNDNS